MTEISLVVGLGNPGNRYVLTRHNVGFRAVESAAEVFEIRVEKKKFYALVGDGKLDDRKVIWVKPQTYMNASGKSVALVLNHFKISPQNMIVISDDIDLSLGKIRIRARGSSGGHKGLQSIIDELGTESFCRIRIGVGPLPKNVNAEDFVLRKFADEENEIVERMFKDVPEIIKTLLLENVENAMNQYNSKDWKLE